MKKILLLVLLALVSVSVSARKSYITVVAHPYSDWEIKMSGDVPNDIPKVTYEGDENGHFWITDDDTYTIGDMLNILSGYGYEVECATPISDFNHSKVQFLLSKEIPSGNQTEIVGDVNNDSEVTVADVNAVVNIILGLAKSNPSIMKQLKEQLQ